MNDGTEIILSILGLIAAIVAFSVSISVIKDRKRSIEEEYEWEIGSKFKVVATCLGIIGFFFVVTFVL